MTQLAMGRNWRHATSEQQRVLVEGSEIQRTGVEGLVRALKGKNKALAAQSASVSQR